MATNLNTAFNLTDATNLFKIKYQKYSENTYNSANVLLGRCKKRYDFTGKQLYYAQPLSFQGGVGSGTLPEANLANYEDATLTAKKLYARCYVDRETIKASMNNEGAFKKATQEVVSKTVESWMRNMSRILFSDGDGALGTLDGAVTGTGTTADPYVCTISTATWKEANFEERDFVNFDTSTDRFEIQTVVPSTRKVSVVAQAGATHTPADTEVMYMQGSKDNDPFGIKQVVDATSSTLYGIDVGRRWQANQQAETTALTVDMINECMLDVEKKCGKTPNMLVTSYKQYRKLLSLLEDQKRYTINARYQPGKGQISFSGVEFMSSQGAIGVFPERFAEDDRIYVLNDNYITIAHRPNFGWFDDDGTVFLRVADEDMYEARYGGYLNLYCVPSFQGVITGLT